MEEGLIFAKVLVFYGLIESNTMRRVKIVCPFHEDINPSMIVDLETGSYFCFGCRKQGNVYNFVMEYEHINYIQAYKYIQAILRNRATANIKQRTYAPQETEQECLLRAKDYYFNLPDVDWETTDIKEAQMVREYMNKRGFENRTLTRSHAKYAYNKQYPIIFPIVDNKEFKGWLGRTTDPEIEKKRKYFNNKGFSRQTTLPGTYTRGKIIFVCEGMLDMQKLKQFGIRNSVALLGWKACDIHIQKLKQQGITTVVSVLDNDECGHNGSLYLNKFFNVIRWRYLKGYKDPGDIKDRETFLKMYNKTMEVI